MRSDYDGSYLAVASLINANQGLISQGLKLNKLVGEVAGAWLYDEKSNMIILIRGESKHASSPTRK